MIFVAKTFSELTTDELYEILKSRMQIFVVEQKINCQDIDDIDRSSIHCFFYDKNRVVAYLRAFSSGENIIKIGRVLTIEHGKGLGLELMKRSVEEIKNRFGSTKLCVHAQKQAIGFYEKAGFSIVSDEYIEEGIVHVTMERYI